MGTDRDWEKFGRTDPYFGVCADPEFSGGATDPTRRAAFFRSGDEHVEQVFSIFRDHVAPDFAPKRALDFGCGVGRIAIPLARRIEHVTGVDVSRSMLVEAQRNADEAGIGNLTLLASDDGLSQLSGEFDFIHSFIVFQHIPPRRGRILLKALLSRIAHGGFGALHLTFDSRLPRWRRLVHSIRRTIPLAHGVGNLLQHRPFGYPLMQMNIYDTDDILSELQSHGCHSIHLRLTQHGAWSGVFFFFQRKELPSL